MKNNGLLCDIVIRSSFLHHPLPDSCFASLLLSIYSIGQYAAVRRYAVGRVCMKYLLI